MKKEWYHKVKRNNKKKNLKSSEEETERRKEKPVLVKKKPKKEEKTGWDSPRLNKYIANAGICSRRKADEFIANGDVMVNDEVVLQMGYRVQEKDVVKFQGKEVKPEYKKVYYLLNKPKNMITTLKDPHGRKTVMDIMSKATKLRIYPVGRLDRNTTGLLLFTNDGVLAKKMMHPSHKVPKIYHASLDKPLTARDLTKIEKGLTLEDGKVEVDWIRYLAGKSKTEVQLEIHLGKNRIVRRIFEHLGYEVKKLDRNYYAGLTKKDLPRGRFRTLSEKEIVMLKHFV